MNTLELAELAHLLNKVKTDNPELQIRKIYEYAYQQGVALLMGEEHLSYNIAAQRFNGMLHTMNLGDE